MLPLGPFLTWTCMSMEWVASFYQKWTFLWCLNTSSILKSFSSTGINCAISVSRFSSSCCPETRQLHIYIYIFSYSNKANQESNQVFKVNHQFIHILCIHPVEKMLHFLAGSVLALPRDRAQNLTVEVALTDFELGIPQPCRANVTSKILGSNHESSSSWVTLGRESEFGQLLDFSCV